MLGPDVFVVESLGLLIGQLHYLAGAVGKSFVHSSFLPLQPKSNGLWRVRLHYKAVPSSDGMTRLVCCKPINNTSSLPWTEAIHESCVIAKYGPPRRNRLQRRFPLSCELHAIPPGTRRLLRTASIPT